MRSIKNSRKLKNMLSKIFIYLSPTGLTMFKNSEGKTIHEEEANPVLNDYHRRRVNSKEAENLMKREKEPVIRPSSAKIEQRSRTPVVSTNVPKKDVGYSNVSTNSNSNSSVNNNKNSNHAMVNDHYKPKINPSSNITPNNIRVPTPNLKK